VGRDGAFGAVRDSLNGLEAARRQTLAILAPFSQAQLDFAPRPGRWSIGEVADHLRLSEQLWRDELHRLVLLARAGKPARLKHSFADINVSPLHIPDSVLSLLETPFSFMNRFVPDSVIGLITEFPILPTRNPDMATPRARRTKAELIADLRAALEETQQLIDSNADLDFLQMTSEHPLMGANNVPQVLNFLARHERRHHAQMNGVSGDSRFPRA
jgi:uncharacterized damage-inducible protein DinB